MPASARSRGSSTPQPTCSRPPRRAASAESGRFRRPLQTAGRPGARVRRTARPSGESREPPQRDGRPAVRAAGRGRRPTASRRAARSGCRSRTGCRRRPRRAPRRSRRCRRARSCPRRARQGLGVDRHRDGWPSTRRCPSGCRRRSSRRGRRRRGPRRRPRPGSADGVGAVGEQHDVAGHLVVLACRRDRLDLGERGEHAVADRGARAEVSPFRAAVATPGRRSGRRARRWCRRRSRRRR